MPNVRFPSLGGLIPKRAEKSYGAEKEERSAYLQRLPPMREQPFYDGVDDPRDSDRIEYVQRAWHDQDDLLRGRDRQVEENIRMLCGQHWSVWSEILGKFVDLTDYLTDDERRWRQFPTMNRLLLWYMITKARMTENPPVVSFQAATGDEKDAQLAEVMDTVFKTIWHDASMMETLDQMTAWLIPSGSAYLKSRIDPEAGDLVHFIGRAVLRLLGPDGQPVVGQNGPIERETDDVPFDEQGNPLAQLTPTGEVEETGQAFAMREGGIVVDALSCLECRGEWGNNIPWHRKRVHMHRLYYTPQSFYETYGIDHPPEITGSQAEGLQEFRRLAYGSGLFGTAGGRFENAISDHTTGSRDGYIEVIEMWHRPSALVEEMRETGESPGGRIMAVTRSKCIRDSPRFARFRYTSPIRQFSFVNVAGRPQGTSPQEMLNGPARTRNRMVRQILEHTNLVSNPIRLVDTNSGITQGSVTNRPGQTHYGSFKDSNEPIKYARPPDLGQDVYKVLGLLTSEHDDLGALAGAMGDPPTTDPSGELVKELRFNSDRYIGPTQQSTVSELARVVEDWIQMVPIIWDREKILKVAGDDQIVRTTTVLPEMFKGGKVDVIPDIESMLPEGRGERQARIHRMWQDSAWGPPDSPEARAAYLELAHFPHMSRAHHPGGADAPMARQNVGRLLSGVPAQEVPLFDWYDKNVHLHELHRFMKGPEYVKQPVHIQQEMVTYREIMIQALIQSEMEELQRQTVIADQMRQADEALNIRGGGAPGGGEGVSRQEGDTRRIEQGPPDRGPTQQMPGGA